MLGGDSAALNRNVVSFVKVDLFGSIQIHSTIQNDSFVYFCGDNGSLSITNNGYILGGSYNPTGPIQGNGILVRYNLDGDTLWMKTFYDTTYSEYLIFTQAKQTIDGGFIAIGETRGIGTYATQFILIKTDSMGNELWRKTYGANNKMNRGTNILTLPDGGFLLGGDTYSATLQDSRNGMVIKTDSLGNEIWLKQVGWLYNDGYARLALAKDGNYIIALNLTEWTYQGIPVGRLSIAKTDTSGSIIWNKQYGIPKLLFNCSTVKELDDGSLIAIGFSANTDTGNTTMPGWIMKITSDGDSVWFREIRKYPNWGYDHYPYDFTHTQDGGFVVCGNIRDVYNGSFDDLWIVKLDSLGCDTPGCQFNSIEGTGDRGQGLEVYPNPFGEEISILLPDGFWGGKLVLYDVQGRKAMETTVPESHGKQTYTVQTPYLKPGVYLVELEGEDGRVWRRKAMKKG